MATSPTKQSGAAEAGQAPPPPSLHNLPPDLSANSIETIPILSALLSRLPDRSEGSTSHSQPTSSPPAAGDPISVKDIPTATDEIKHRLQKARGAIKALPDMWRSVEAQEKEIAELEKRIAVQRGVLQSLGSVGKTG